MIGVITELGVDEQKVLKEMIEAVSLGKVLSRPECEIERV